jgi:ribosome-binding factor A
VSRRTARVGDLLRMEIAEVIQRELADPRIGLATVTAVEVSPDLTHARVQLSVLGSEAERQESIAAMTRASGFIRRQLGRRLRLRVTPELAFELDRGAEYSQRISDLLEELGHDDESP